jgi:hypothetical protein
VSVISLTYNGTEILQDVLISSASFESEANGIAGLCRFSVKDDGHTYAPGYFKAGGVLNLVIDGQLVWGGWVMSVGRQYPFDAMNTTDPTTTARYWDIQGADWNVLFTRRYTHSSDPTTEFKTYTGGTPDGDVVRDILTNYTDLAGDGISFDGINNVGPVSPFQAEEFRPAQSQGEQVGTVLNRLIQNTGALYYIDPDRVFQYRDVEQPSAPFALSDQPGVDAGSVGYRNMVIYEAGNELANDVMVWGAGLGTDQVVFARITDPDSVSMFGTFQYGELMTDAYLLGTVTGRAQSYVYGSPSSHRGHRETLPLVTLTMFTPGLRVGMVVDFASHVFDAHGLAVIDNPPPVTADLANFMARIRHIESNDNYTDVNRSSYAYGAYQIMPGNWAGWACDALNIPRSQGVSARYIDPSSWYPLPTQANQDATAANKMGNLYHWLGDWRRVAAFWRAGSECTRQPSEWSRGTIFYVNHACIPLGFPETTASTLLPPLPVNN